MRKLIGAIGAAAGLLLGLSACVSSDALQQHDEEQQAEIRTLRERLDHVEQSHAQLNAMRQVVPGGANAIAGAAPLGNEPAVAPAGGSGVIPPAPQFTASGMPAATPTPAPVSPPAPVAMANQPVAGISAAPVNPPAPAPTGDAAPTMDDLRQDLQTLLANQRSGFSLDAASDHVTVTIGYPLVFDDPNRANISPRIGDCLKAIGDIAAQRPGTQISVETVTAGASLAGEVPADQAEAVAQFLKGHSNLDQMPAATSYSSPQGTGAEVKITMR